MSSKKRKCKTFVPPKKINILTCKKSIDFLTRPDYISFNN